jgi:photosystem II stability/assembly factor-like uncharacterized protein
VLGVLIGVLAVCWGPSSQAARAPRAVVLFAGTMQGDLLMSADAGTHWRHLWKSPGGLIALAVAAEGRVLYAGTNHARVWRSADGGRHWRQVNGRWPHVTRVQALAVHPRNANIVYAGTDDGLYRSATGGMPWARLVLPRTARARRSPAIQPVFSIVFDGQTPPNAWAGTWSPPAQGAGAAAPALYQSVDRGQTWRPLPAGLPPARSGVYVVALAPSPAPSRELSIGTSSGVYTLRETNARTWGRRGDVVLGGTTVYALAVGVGTAGTLYVGTASGVYVVRDRSSPVRGLVVPADQRRLGVRVLLGDPLRARWAYAATDKGVLRTTDGGLHWRFWTCRVPGCTRADVTSLALAVVPQR